MRDSMADSGLDAFGFGGQFRHHFARCNFERAPIAQPIFIFSSITLGDSVDFRKGDCAVFFLTQRHCRPRQPTQHMRPMRFLRGGPVRLAALNLQGLQNDQRSREKVALQSSERRQNLRAREGKREERQWYGRQMERGEEQGH